MLSDTYCLAALQVCCAGSNIPTLIVCSLNARFDFNIDGVRQVAQQNANILPGIGLACPWVVIEMAKMSSVLGFRVDEYMESVAGPAFEPHFDELKHTVDELAGLMVGQSLDLLRTHEKSMPSAEGYVQLVDGS